jgi:uncharacterized membrane protein YcgQ (UPF0703/DUF1980 family)
MKFCRIIPMMFLALAVGCTQKPSAFKTADAATGDIIEIREKMFLAETNEIYLNVEDYLGKTIRYEGFFDQFTNNETRKTYCVVIRNGPGCCPGVDNTVGFEVFWDKGWPNRNDWVEATGVLESYKDDADGREYPRLRLSSLKRLPVRGADFVMQ